MTTPTYTLPIEFQNPTKGATPIAVAWGDGIGPEIMQATLTVLAAAGAKINPQEIHIGEKIYLSGVKSGMPDSAWESLRNTRLFLKAPITTPQGGGYKSLNVTIRKTLGLFANVRPCYSYHPFVSTHHTNMDVVIIRENEEDTYAGIEHQQTDEVTQCLKVITRTGSERIIRYAFEYAHHNDRKKVTCFIKDNIMKITDGLFHRVFKEVAQEYPEIQADSLIVDIGTALLADQPERFDVIVTENLYGDIISDVAAQIAGSVGLAGSSNIGEHFAMFEAIHGSAPTIAGKNIANPTALLQAAIMMLIHIEQNPVAEKIHNAILKTLEDGIHTADIYKVNQSTQLVGTQEFAQAVIARLGQKPSILKAAHYPNHPRQSAQSHTLKKLTPAKKELVGFDLYLHWNHPHPNEAANHLGKLLETLTPAGLRLARISSRGIRVYPNGLPETLCLDHWSCRFFNTTKGKPISHRDIVVLLNVLEQEKIDFIKLDNLYTFNGAEGFSSESSD